MLVGSRVRKSTIPEFWPPLINKPGSDFLLLFYDHLRSPILVLIRPPYPSPLAELWPPIHTMCDFSIWHRAQWRMEDRYVSPFPFECAPSIHFYRVSHPREITMPVRLPAIIVTYQWTREPKPADVPFLGKTLQGTKRVIPRTLFRGTVSVNGGSAW